MLTLNQLVESAAKRFPDRPAVIEPTGSISYRELDRRANQVARFLIKEGVEPGDRVALFQPKSRDGVAALLGVLKCGAAYVPIDPNAPADRARYVFEHCEVAVAFSAGRPLMGLRRSASAPAATAEEDVSGTQGKSDTAENPRAPLPRIIVPRKDLRDDCALPTVIAFEDAIEAEAAEPIERRFPNTQLAYLLYTSGSTGAPKGVAITHAQSLAFVETAAEIFGLTENDVLSSHAPFNFDLSVIDLFCAFFAGAAVSVLPEKWLSFPAKIGQVIEDSGITVWNSVPSALVQLVNRGTLEKRNLEKLRLVMFAGEPFPMKHLRRLSEFIPHATLMNVYGQTEANSSTYFIARELPDDDNALLPIGKPFPNYDVIVLDAAGRAITQPGVEGELYVRGGAVGAGYYKDPERTRAAFVQNPIDDTRPEVVYKTGDRVAWNDNFDLCFRGRVDAAVKVRGFRVELSEIEAVVHAMNGVRECAVAPVLDESQGHRLVLFFSAEESASVDPTRIAEHVLSQLPKYMLPDPIVPVAGALPRGPTGKIDRQALASKAEALDE